MATSAFKSTTKRTPIGKNDKSSSSSAHRRSRSLSRFSRPIPSDDFSDDVPLPSRGKFVNTVRGSGVPEISLDDLAIQLFSSGERGHPVSRSGDVSEGERVVNGSQRRGRSVSRQGSESNNYNVKGYSGGGKVNSDGNNSRRRRSVSVVGYQISDSESDLDHSQNSRNYVNSRRHSDGRSQVPVLDKTGAPNNRQGLRRSFCQKDLKYHDGYSSHSSSLTDDEGRDACSNKNGSERTIRTVYAQKKGEHPTGDNMNSGLYEAMRQELRHAVEEIRMELEQSMGKTNKDCLQSGKSDDIRTGTIRKNNAPKSEQSEKWKRDILAELLLEEQRGRDISKIVKGLLSDPKNNAMEMPSGARKRSNDRNRMSKRLNEEAEKYIEDFISNVEDTDISSLDGERSDTSSTFLGITKAENFLSPPVTKSLPVEMDGLVLPWLQWETSNEASPLSCKSKEPTSNQKTNLWNAAQQEATPAQDISMHSISSHGSWSPGGLTDGHSMNIGEIKGGKYGELGSYQARVSLGGTRSHFDVEEYLKRRSEEEFLFERYNQQQRIHSGGLLLCNQMFF